MRLSKIALCALALAALIFPALTIAEESPEFSTVANILISGNPRAKQVQGALEPGDTIYLTNTGSKKVSLSVQFYLVNGKKTAKLFEKKFKLKSEEFGSYLFNPSAKILSKKSVRKLLTQGSSYRLRIKVPKRAELLFEQKRLQLPTAPSTTTTTTMPVTTNPPPPSTTTTTTTTTQPQLPSTTTTTLAPVTTTTTQPVINATCDSGITISSLYITTPHDRFPNFGANPTKIAGSSGYWSSSAIWEAPDGSPTNSPGAGDIVSIPAGISVVYDLVSTAPIDTVSISGLLAFRTDINTALYVNNLLVLPCAELMVGSSAAPVLSTVKAEIVFSNSPLNTAADSEQYGNGLIALGRVNMHGAVKNLPFVRLAAEPTVGATSLTLSEAVSGWLPGDKVLLPDSRLVIDPAPNHIPNHETVVISGVSANGKTLTLATPLQFGHPGVRKQDGTLEYAPHVGNLSRNVVVRSQSANGVRGHVMFVENANIDVRYVSFGGLGRTTIAALDNTTFNSSGGVTHVGTNQAGRYPLYVNHVTGSGPLPANGHRFTLVGNSVTCPLDPMTFKWGITINDSDYGLIRDNVIFNWGGAGFVTESGLEDFNTIDHNYVVKISGNGASREDNGFPGREGSGLWLFGSNNYIRNNVVANVPLRAYVLFHSPILQFQNNETYGGRAGLTMWEVNGAGTGQPNIHGPRQTIKDFLSWNNWEYGVGLGYPSFNVTFDGLIVRNYPAALTGTGFTFGDYETYDFIVRNADIQGLKVGIIPPAKMNINFATGAGTFLLEDSYLRNYFNVFVETPNGAGNGQGGSIAPGTTTIRNVQFDTLPGVGNVTDNFGAPIPQSSIFMAYNPRNGSNVVQRYEVLVEDYDGNQGEDFQVYYLEQHPTFIVPQTESVEGLFGSPASGLSNYNNWLQYGIAISGSIAPCLDNTSHAEIHGYVCP